MKDQWKAAVTELIEGFDAEISDTRNMLADLPKSKRGKINAVKARGELDSMERLLAAIRAALAAGDMWHAVYAAYVMGQCEKAAFFEAIDGWQGLEQVQHGRAGNELSHGAKEFDYGYAENAPWDEWRGEVEGMKHNPGKPMSHSAAVREWQKRHPEYGYEFHYLRRKLRKS